ncbi:MAG: hypothetical protein J7L90_00650 [Dehalococcoidia bacterium]|nr:hypothetical protein [Dehalococcoidia bacterium]
MIIKHKMVMLYDCLMVSCNAGFWKGDDDDGIVFRDAAIGVFEGWYVIITRLCQGVV